MSSGPAAPEFHARLSELTAGAGTDAVQVSFCGPEGLLAAVQEQLRKCGIPPSAVQFEHFNFR